MSDFTYVPTDITLTLNSKASTSYSPILSFPDEEEGDSSSNIFWEDRFNYEEHWTRSY